MQYLKLSRSGIWYFRYKAPVHVRHLFNGRHEIKKSLRTSDKPEAELSALQLLRDIKEKIMEERPRITERLPLTGKGVEVILN